MILEKAWKRAWKPPDRSTPWEWCEKHLRVDKTSAFPGPWRSSTSPWVKEPMEVWADNTVSDETIMCSAQSSKTQTAIGCISWSIGEDPGPGMWVMAAQDEAKTFARTRLMPTLDQCEPVAKLMPSNRHEKATLEINFASMPLVINGANSQSKLQSKPIRWLILDEVRNYPPGALEMVLKRTRAFWNARRLKISTPHKVHDAVHRAFLDGDQRYYHVECSACRDRWPLRWAQMKWDDNEVTHPTDGQWNFDALAETIRYECPTCKHAIKDRADQRKTLAASGIWVAHNKNAPKNKVSFTWNAMLPPWVKWRDLVEEFIKAKEAVKVGAIEPLKTFINESLGEPWEDRYDEDDAPLQKGEYNMGEKWEVEHQIFLTVDVQKDHFYYVARAWTKEGESRQVSCGKLLTFEEIYDKQRELNINGKRVLIDSGFRANEIYEQCIKYGWTALKGEDKEYFNHVIPNQDPIPKVYAVPKRVDPGIGTVSQGRRYATLILWSNPSVKDRLSLLRRGQGPRWMVARNVPQDYDFQMDSETKRLRHNKITGQQVWEWVRIGSRPNHYWDCECMQIVAAISAGLLFQK